MTLLEELKWRELFYDATDMENIEEFLEQGKGSFYLGADPTGPSLHVGHLVMYLTAMRLVKKGFKPVLLIGGATGQIGDPKQQGERKMLSEEVVKKNVELLSNQVKNIFGFETVVNNYDWISKLSVIDFLRDFGKCFNVSYMINKETVKARLESGISYTEFSYQILQALDFEHLYNTYGVNMQIGGQDQWGNITSGVELIRKHSGADAKVYGLTFGLITRSDGTKFGKSEGGQAVWLNPEMTSPYEFYQFWINTPDSDVIKRLKQFTFLTKEEIEDIEAKMQEHPEERLAQKTLAFLVTSLVHSEAKANEAIKMSEALFSGDIKALNAHQIEEGFKDLKAYEGLEGKTLVDAIIELSLASSKREAREFITNGAVSVNGDKVTDLSYIISKDNAIEGKYIVIRRGKKKYALIKF